MATTTAVSPQPYFSVPVFPSCHLVIPKKYPLSLCRLLRGRNYINSPVFWAQRPTMASAEIARPEEVDRVYTAGVCSCKGLIAGIGVDYGPNDPRNVSQLLVINPLTTTVMLSLNLSLGALHRAVRDICGAMDLGTYNRPARIYSDSQWATCGLPDEWDQVEVADGIMVERDEVIEEIIERYQRINEYHDRQGWSPFKIVPIVDKARVMAAQALAGKQIDDELELMDMIRH